MKQAGRTSWQPQRNHQPTKGAGQASPYGTVDGDMNLINSIDERLAPRILLILVT